jgi:hypothetical protein
MKVKIKYLVIISLLMVLSVSRNYATIIHEESSIETISPSINYIEKTQFKSNKWIIIKSLVVDISDEGTNIQALYNQENLRQSKKMSELVAMQENILGAINGDFFNSNQKTAIGPLIDNKKLIYNGIDDATFNVFGITKVNKPFIGHINRFKPDVKIGNTTIPVSYMNKNFTNLNEIVLLDNTYGKTSIGNSTAVELTEVVINNNQVVDLRVNESPIEIPKNGFIVVIPKDSNFDTKNISIGDSFIYKDPKILDFLDTLIGGGSILVDKGELNSEFSLPINGNHPRSAIGFTEDYTKVILTTVEGRKTFVPGVTESELAEIMIDLGAYYAINLDGGGSSTLIKRDFGKVSYQPTNYLSDGTERRVYNGIGIASNYEAQDIQKLELILDQQHTIPKQPISLELLGSDLYYNPIIINDSLVEFSSNLQGEFIDNTFYPTETGKGIIKAEYNGLTITKPIEVHDKLAEIKLNQYHLKLDQNETVELKAEVITNKGYKIPIDLEQLTFDLDHSNFSISQNQFTLREDLQDRIITVSYGELKTEISLNMNTFESVILDDFEEIKGKHGVYPVDLNGKFNLFNTSIDGSKSGRLFYNFTKYPTETRASYYIYDHEISVAKNVNKIKLDVFGTLGKNHWLRLKVSDKNGVAHNLTLARNIDWQGWKTVETEIPSYIEGPISIQRIYVVETDYSNANDGLILFDNLRMEVPIEINLNKNTNYEDVFETTMDTNYRLDNLYVTNENTDIQSKNFKIITNNNELIKEYPNLSLNIDLNYSSLKDESKLVLKLNNSSQTLNHDSGKQWLFFKEKLENSADQNLIIYLNNPLTFKNNLEEDLFLKLIKEHQNTNKSNIFIIAESDSFKLNYIEGFPVINIDTEKSFELRFNFFKSFAKFNLELKQ